MPTLLQLPEDMKASLMRQHIVQQKDVWLVALNRLHHLMLLPRVEHVKASVLVQGLQQQRTEALIVIFFRCGISVRPLQFDLILHN